MIVERRARIADTDEGSLRYRARCRVAGAVREVALRVSEERRRYAASRAS